MLNRRLIAAGCAAPLCAAAAFAGTSFANRGAAVTHHVRLATRVNSKLLKDFAIFRSADHRAGRSAKIAGAAAPALPVPMGASRIGMYGLNTADTQYVQSGTSSVWVVPGSEGACMVTSYPTPVTTLYSTHCETASEITADGFDVAISWQPPASTGYTGGEVVASLVPDGNSTVSVSGPAGSVPSESVSDNVAVHDFPNGDVKLSYLDANGATKSMVQQFPTAPPSTATATARVGQLSVHKIG